MKRWPFLLLFCVAVVIEHLPEMAKDWAATQLKETPDDEDDDDVK